MARSCDGRRDAPTPRTRRTTSGCSTSCDAVVPTGQCSCAADRLDDARLRADELARGYYPGHLLLRYLAEAYRKRGDVDAALELLIRARTTVSSQAKDFVRLVLLSSTPMESRLLLERGLPSVREAAQEFAAALDDWQPGFVDRPAGDEGDDAWIAALEDAVARLPY